MWHINYQGMTLQEVLIMAYMNSLETVSVVHRPRIPRRRVKPIPD